MGKVLTIVAGLMVLGLIGYGLSIRRGQPAPPAGPASVEPRPAPDFTLKDYAGHTVSLADFRGKPAVVNSWAVWCPFCREELKDFAAVKRELGDQVAIIAVDRAEPLAVAKRFSDSLGVSEDLIFLLDPEDSFYRAIGGFSMPETIFVDANGSIRIHKRGPMPLEEIREKVQSIL